MPGTMEVLGLFEVCVPRLYLSQVNCGRYMKKILVGIFSLPLLYPTKFFQKRHLFREYICLCIYYCCCYCFSFAKLSDGVVYGENTAL